MKKWLLDTNTLSDLLRSGDGPVAKRVVECRAEHILISAIVTAEMEFGIAKIGSGRIRRSLDELKRRHPVIGFEPPADRIYGELRAEMARAGRGMGPNDLFIAAHALALSATLVSDDRAFEGVPELKLENWLRAS